VNFQLPLSGSHLRKNAYLQLRLFILSTPSLGITRNLYMLPHLCAAGGLSTPSLGITCYESANKLIGSDRPFNSLSRDHRSGEPAGTAAWARNFQLPLSGSQSDLNLRTIIRSKLLSTPSLGITDTIDRIVSKAGEVFQLPLSGSRILSAATNAWFAKNFQLPLSGSLFMIVRLVPLTPSFQLPLSGSHNSPDCP